MMTSTPNYKTTNRLKREDFPYRQQLRNAVVKQRINLIKQKSNRNAELLCSLSDILEQSNDTTENLIKATSALIKCWETQQKSIERCTQNKEADIETIEKMTTTLKHTNVVINDTIEMLQDIIICKGILITTHLHLNHLQMDNTSPAKNREKLKNYRRMHHPEEVKDL